MVLITIYALFCHEECGLVVRTAILDRPANLYIYMLEPVYSGVLSVNISFDTPTTRFILYNTVPASDLDLMGFI